MTEPPIHLRCLPNHHVLVGTTIEVTEDGSTTTHVVAPGLATYLINRYASSSTIQIAQQGATP